MDNEQKIFRSHILFARASNEAIVYVALTCMLHRPELIHSPQIINEAVTFWTTMVQIGGVINLLRACEMYIKGNKNP